jgi:hypothetical protein
MFSGLVATDVQRRPQSFEAAQQQLLAIRQWREVRPGYVLDEGDEDYRLANGNLAEAKAQRDDIQPPKVKLDLTQRKRVLQLIDKFSGHH